MSGAEYRDGGNEHPDGVHGMLQFIAGERVQLDHPEDEDSADLDAIVAGLPTELRQMLDDAAENARRIVSSN